MFHNKQQPINQEEQLMQQMISVIDFTIKIAPKVAEAKWVIFTELKKVGFTDEQALDIVKFSSIPTNNG